ncbi:MAG: helix-turn-helix domain-containing protein [Jatrophihabitantaceae bacterium]
MAVIEEAAVSERELARRAGLSHATVNHLMTGRRSTCTLETAIAITRALGCPVGTLFVAERPAEHEAICRL